MRVMMLQYHTFIGTRCCRQIIYMTNPTQNTIFMTCKSEQQTKISKMQKRKKIFITMATMMMMKNKLKYGKMQKRFTWMFF
jgi:hypothetical protein